MPHVPVAPRFLPGGPAAAPANDPYAWMRDRDLPAMRDYLAAERAYYDRHCDAGLRDELAGELIARVPAAEESVRWRRDGHTYFTRTLPGCEFKQFCRAGESGVGESRAGAGAERGGGESSAGAGAERGRARSAGAGKAEHGGDEVLLDENLLGHSYVDLGVREVSPDGRLLAYSADFDGDEIYQLRVRDLASGADLADRIERTYYGLAWAADSRSFFYTVPDACYRPHEVWLHRLGTGPDVLVFREGDERFELTVRGTRSGAYVLIESASRDTTETLVIPADDTGAAPAVLQRRRAGVEYRADHGDGPDGGEFYLVTNDGAVEFRLVRGPARARAGWTEVIAGSPGTRLVSADVFGRYLVIEQRHGAATQLRIVDRGTGEQRLVEAESPQCSLALAANEDYAATAVTVRTQSLIDPPAWYDVDLASGRWELRKRQEVPGYDPAAYVTERITAPAADGTQVPVTVAYRRGTPRDGTASCLLYGYGAYESCEWPEFAVSTPSLLDRGFVYAVAHVRGGGEGGRGWWLDGRLDRKRNTFTDFIAAADMLAEAGWAADDRIVSRGLSAGGLLQGAVFSLAPRRWRAVVAEVPFVDCVTTMLDPGIPLTISEWDEWGDPRDPAIRAYMESYSPYDNPPEGRRPDLLVTGSLHDPRVLIHEPAKWVARLRATDSAGSRLLFRPELGSAGHTGPSGRYGRLRHEAEILAFIVTAAG